MPGDQAFKDGYGFYELELASGETIRCQALTLGQAAHFLKLLEVADGSAAISAYLSECADRDEEPTDEGISEAVRDASGEMAAAQLEIMDTFPEAVGAEEAFQEAHITPGEFFDAVRSFMALRRPSRNGKKSSRATETPEEERKRKTRSRATETPEEERKRKTRSRVSTT